jgi:hypothetical protein
MRALVLVGGFALLVAGCTRLATPHAPIVMTTEGRRCVRQCQSNHEKCVTTVNRAIGDDVWRFANPRLRACHDDLGSCYAICPG